MGFAGIATVPAFYLLAREATRPGTALLTATLLAFNPWHIQFSRSSSAATLLVLSLTLFAWAVLRGATTANPHAKVPSDLYPDPPGVSDTTKGGPDD